MRSLIFLMAEEEGATSMEYAFIASLISIVIFGAVAVIGGNVTAMFNNIAAGFGR